MLAYPASTHVPVFQSALLFRMSSPAISICIPAYNAECYIAETLNSVRAQGFSDWELIVIDDDSCDNTEQIVRSFAQSVPQPVRYTRQAPSRGPSATRNAGISAARAEWIALLDSDDIWLPEHLETCLKTAVETGAELIHSGSILFDSETGADTSVRAPSAEDIAGLPLTLFKSSYIIQPSSAIITRALWSRAGRFDPSLRYAEDLDMWLRCFRVGGRIAYTGRETCRYRRRAFSLSTHNAPTAESVARAFEKHLDWSALPANFCRIDSARAWSASARLHWRSQPKLAAAHFRRAYSLHWNPVWFLQEMFCRCMVIFGIKYSNQRLH